MVAFNNRVHKVCMPRELIVLFIRAIVTAVSYFVQIINLTLIILEYD